MSSKKEQRWASKKRKIEAFLEVAQLNDDDPAVKRRKVRTKPSIKTRSTPDSTLAIVATFHFAEFCLGEFIDQQV